MNEVTRCTLQLAEALKKSDAYRRYKEAGSKIEEQPLLRQRLDDFRKQNYLLQNSDETEDLFAEMEELEKAYYVLCKEPLIKEYLAAELEMCRMVQECGTEIMTAVDMEIDGFADFIKD